MVANAPASPEHPIVFEDIAEHAGIGFRHFNGLSGDWHYTELVGGGCGLADLTGNGLLDIVLVQSGPLPHQIADLEPPDRSGHGGTRVLANRSARQPDGVWNIRFEDITEASGLRAYGYGMGLTAADLTGNGHIDLYITNYGPNSLWHNNGDGTFTDITEPSGTGDPSWSVSAAAADLDNNGRLDLFVVNYVHYDPASNPQCLARNTRRDYCGPSVFEPASDTLYQNQGNGRFLDVTDGALAGNRAWRGLGVVIADLDGDGLPDIFVANDGDVNQFWRNNGDRSFSEMALVTGTAVNRHGEMEAGMGVATGDYNNSGYWDLFLTHLDGESNTLYRNLGQGHFIDDTAAAGLLVPSLPDTGFGTGWADFDLDGRLDIYVANGAVRVIEPQREQGLVLPLRQSDRVFRNIDGRRFEDVSATAGTAVTTPTVGRGAAFGDINNNGLIDILLCDNHAPPRLLLNRTGSGNQWLGLRLVTGEPARDALGARTAILINGQPRHWRRAANDGSYLSASDPRVIFGLGRSDITKHDVVVHWPDGSLEQFGPIAVGSYTTLNQGQGNKWDPDS